MIDILYPCWDNLALIDLLPILNPITVQAPENGPAEVQGML